ncbi:DNA-directed DNA polymerase [Spirochaetia bacterium]|nr:DNA-directed DNA polymerase [Spirochaetia bacterium]
MNIRLGLCSAYSFLYGVHKPDTLIHQLKTFETKIVCIADKNNLYGVHSFLEAAKERGLRPVIGSALTCGKGTVYCFVENRAGFGRLCELLTMRNKDNKHFNPLPLLAENAGGLVLATPDEFVLEGLAGKVKRLYAAITPLDTAAVAVSRRLNIPLCFLDNSLFLDKEDFTVHKVLRAIGLLKTVGNLGPTDTAAQGRVLRPSKELHRRLVSWPGAVQGTQEIADLCQFNELFDGWVFPGYEAGGLSVADELRRRVYAGAAARYGELGDGEIERIDYELGIIEKKGFSSYFLTIDDIVKMASHTCGRGSGAASIVSYGLEITNVDPIAHNLYFERFLNPARPDPPDLDIDFAWDERDALIKAVIEKFGPDHCARVANHNFFRYRGALRETAKAYGMSNEELGMRNRELRMADGDSYISHSTFLTPHCTKCDDPVWNEIYSIAARIEGLPRGLGMHCGGLVITPGPIYKSVPVEKSAEGFPLLAWEKEGTEAAGFVKIDLLGNRSLAVIRDAIKNVELGMRNEELRENLRRANENRDVIAALARGDSIGVFYIESPAMRQLQKKTGAGDFEHIVIHSSIIRPAANKFINEYVRRLKGGEWEPLHPRLEKILDETYGILCYQEDVSKTAVALAGFDEAEADKLRKVIAKKAGAAKLAVYKKQFFEGCRGNGVADDTTQKIWEMMLSFDGYSFCKPHSASYAMVSFQSAYLRVHHPAEFMAAVLSNQGGYYRPHAYIAECRRMGLFTVGPDVNVSRWKYYGKGGRKIRNEELGMRNVGGTVVIGLMAVRGLSQTGAEAILTERDRGGDFFSLEDFARRVKLGRDDIVALCPAGVFDSIADGLPRTMQARKLLGKIRNEEGGKIRNEELGMRNGELFAAEAAPVYKNEESGIRNEKRKMTDNNIYIPHSSSHIPHSSTDLWEEYRALGFLRKVHPLALWKDDVLAVKYRVKALHIGEYVGRFVKMVGWPVTQKDVWTKDGLTMSFLSLEDETGIYETVIFPKVYERYNRLLFDQRPLLVYGRVTDDMGAVSFEVQKIEVLGVRSTGQEVAALRYAGAWG